MNNENKRFPRRFLRLIESNINEEMITHYCISVG